MPEQKTTTAASKAVDQYLAGVPAQFRSALEQLRRTVREIVPEATEVISYRVPTFKYHGRMLVSYAAFSEHCSFFPGAGPIEAHKRNLKSFQTSKGTIRFTPEKPLSSTLIKKLVKTRIKLNEEALLKRKAA